MEESESDGLRTTLSSMRVVASNRRFLGNALSCGFAFVTLFAYLAGSSFALENVYGLSPQQFSLIFALDAVGLISASQINGRLVSVAAGFSGLVGLLTCMFVVLTSVGFIAPNATNLALNDFPKSAGSVSALLGLLQFAIGAGLAPLVG